MGKRKIAVVIDDDPFMATLFKKVLPPLGYKLYFYGSALDIPCVNFKKCTGKCPFRKNIPELFITDIVLPGMTGIELLRLIRKNGCKFKKIAIMSGHFWGDDLKKTAEDLNCKHFEKPFLIEELKEWIEEESD